MKISRKWWLTLSLAIFLVLCINSAILSKLFVVIERPTSVIAQLLDTIGVPSTLYMADVSCVDCNQFHANYVIDAQAGIDCSADHEIFLLMLAISNGENFDRRMNVRQTWGSVGEHHGHAIRTYFICGRSNDSDVQVQLEKEAAYWGDIVQIDLPDIYTSLTNKTIAALNWAIGRCGNHAHFILKTDDDSFNVPQHMVDYLLSHVPLGEPFVGGLCASGEEPNRVHWHKWYVPDSSYPGSVFPLHCKGRAYVLSSAGAMLIVAASRNVLFNAMEDVFVTGVCRAVAAIPCTCMPGIPRIPEVATDCDVASGRVSNLHYILTMNKMKRLWLLANNETARTVCKDEIASFSAYFGLWQVGGLFMVAILLGGYFVRRMRPGNRLNMHY